MEQGVVVSGIAYDKNVARITVLGVADLPGVLARMFGALADEQIDVDIIVQSGVKNGKPISRSRPRCMTGIALFKYWTTSGVKFLTAK